MKKRVLFLCTANSARSIMAEALLKHHGSEQFDVFSAGTLATAVDSRTVQAIEAFGITTTDLHSKPMAQFAGEHFDFVITLCSKASQECRHWPAGGVIINWDFPDPVANPDPMAFKRTFQEINERIKLFVLVNSRETGQSLQPPTALEFFKLLGDETRLLSLLLVTREGELCVCELVEALNQAQPTISRHLAMLRKAGLLLDRRQGQWVYYRLHPLLPAWMAAIIQQSLDNNEELLREPLERLAKAPQRPSCEEIACDA